jgi:pilus assembly protein CpaE
MRRAFSFSRPSADLRFQLQQQGLRAAYDPAAFPGGVPPSEVSALFPQIDFAPLAGPWASGALSGADVLIAHADAADGGAVDRVIKNLRDSAAGSRVLVVLAHPDLDTTRRLLREGASDVLAEPLTEVALGAALDRLVGRLEREGLSSEGSGHVVSVLQAGGGCGATATATQVATILADGGQRKVCVADLDVQFGQAALYLDVRPTISMAQVMSASADLGEMHFSESLPAHPSGARVLAAPPEFMPLESLTGEAVDGLLAALRREFEIVVLDLPSAWTAWTYRALRQSDHIVLVTQLSVPHAHLVRRQFQLLETQRLDDIPLTLFCNRLSSDNASGVSVRSVEGALGRQFDVVAPEDRKLMGEAINQGVALSMLRRGTKLEKAMTQIAERAAPARAAQTRTGRKF